MIKESGIVETEYQPRTPERLIEILKSRGPNPRSYQNEAATIIAELQAENARLSQDLKDRLDAWVLAMQGKLAAESSLAELQAERDRLNSELDTANKNHRSMARQLAETGERALAAEPSLHRVRGETIEECASLAENQVFAVLPDQMTTRELIKAQRNQIAASIRSLNITGLDTGAVKTGAAG